MAGLSIPVGMNPGVKQMMAGLGADKDLEAGNMFANRMDALNAAKAGLG